MNLAKLDHRRKGMAIYVVLLIMVAMFLLIFSMIRISGQMRGASADQRQKLRARLAAEGAVSLAETDILEVGSDLYSIPTGYKFSRKVFASNGDTGIATTTIKAVSQGTVSSGTMKGLNAYVYPIVVTSTGTSEGGAKAPLGLELELYQVPLFQYGQFGEGGLGFNPGASQAVMGPVHSNGSISFSPISATVTVQGPVTAHKSICWKNRSSGIVSVFTTPTNPSSPWTVGSLATGCVGPGSGPPSTGNYTPMTPNADSLGLPVAGGATLNDLLQLATPTDPPSLRRQKFDWIVQDPSKASAVRARFIAGSSSPAWASGPYRFFLRATWRWVRFWKVDIAAMLAASGDSLFYLADTSRQLDLDASLKDSVANAFVLFNGANLSRNVSIVTPNMAFLVGDFNTGTPRRNAMVGSPRVFHVSSAWLSASDAIFARGAYATLPWTRPAFRTYSGQQPSCMNAGGAFTNRRTCYTAMFGYVPSNITQNSAFLGSTGSVMEDWWDYQNPARHQGTITLNGSFVSPSSGNFIGSRPSDLACEGGGGGHLPDTAAWYTAPLRNNSFDTRFSALSNMPPFTPYLSNLSQKQWREGP